MADILEYKCPCCGGAIQFDSGIQKMKCPYCDTEFEMETLLSLDAALNEEKPDSLSWDTPDAQNGTFSEQDGVRVYVCKSCGGEIVTDTTTSASMCPYCGNPVVMAEQVAGTLRPDCVIPFKLDREAAKKKLLDHLSGKKFLPKVFRDENHIDEIKGVYVPFWLFDADADAQLRFRGTRVRSWSDRNYRYSETQFYSVQRGGSLGFQNVPVDGSEKIPDDLTESLEPFDASEAVDFQTAYLAGYLADKYDVDAETSVERANARIRKTVESAFTREASGYMTLNLEQSNIQLHGDTRKVRYALYPVWLLNTTWNGQKYVFAMNGQTGKFVGNLPIDKSLYWAFVWKRTAIIGAIVYAILTLIGRLG